MYSKVDYYNVGIECIDIIEDLNLHFSCGNAFKYLYRCNKLKPKGSIIDDLNKAIYYLNKMGNKPRLNRNAKVTKYLSQLDVNLFSGGTMSAIKHTLAAGTAESLETYKLEIHSAISDIEFVLYNEIQ